METQTHTSCNYTKDVKVSFIRFMIECILIRLRRVDPHYFRNLFNALFLIPVDLGSNIRMEYIKPMNESIKYCYDIRPDKVNKEIPCDKTPSFVTEEDKLSLGVYELIRSTKNTNGQIVSKGTRFNVTENQNSPNYYFLDMPVYQLSLKNFDTHVEDFMRVNASFLDIKKIG